jgi:quercetin dioxygenase-like cupin family protein
MLDDLARVLKISDLFQISGWHHKLVWQPFGPGVEIHRLYGDGRTGPTAALLRFQPGGRVPLHEHVGYEHILVLAGSQVDENSRAEAGMLIVNPPGTSHSILSEHGCLVLAVYEKPVRFLAPFPDPAAAVPPTPPPQPPAPPPTPPAPPVLLAVNGTLMRGLELNPNLLAAGATFVRETQTEPAYRLWSIADRHPAMVRVAPHENGVAVAVEIWSVPRAGMAAILLQEPPGLTIGKVRLADGTEVLGVLGEPELCRNQREITEFRGWRAYIAHRPDPTAPRP